MLGLRSQAEQMIDGQRFPRKLESKTIDVKGCWLPISM